MNKQTSVHIPPKYYSYSGGYDNVTVCSDCDRTGLYEDQHPVQPCPDCGGKIIEGKTGRWIKPIVKGILFKKTIKNGYWELRK